MQAVRKTDTAEGRVVGASGDMGLNVSAAPILHASSGYLHLAP